MAGNDKERLSRAERLVIMRCCSQMDLAKRQAVQKALEQAIENRLHVSIVRADGQPLLLQGDITCYETHMSATDTDGRLVTINYEDINSVGAK